MGNVSRDDAFDACPVGREMTEATSEDIARIMEHWIFLASHHIYAFRGVPEKALAALFPAWASKIIARSDVRVRRDDSNAMVAALISELVDGEHIIHFAWTTAKYRNRGMMTELMKEAGVTKDTDGVIVTGLSKLVEDILSKREWAFCPDFLLEANK